MAITMTATLTRRISMRLIACLVLVNFDAAAGWAQGSKYPPLSEYMMAQEAEVALARSAAPENVSAHATVKILTTSGYKVAAQGDNGFVCIVMRGWAAAISTTARERDVAYDAKVRSPHCFDPVASRTVLPLQELQAKRIRSLKKFRRHMPKASCRKWRRSHSRTCSLRTKILGRDWARGILT